LGAAVVGRGDEAVARVALAPAGDGVESFGDLDWPGGR